MSYIDIELIRKLVDEAAGDAYEGFAGYWNADGPREAVIVTIQSLLGGWADRAKKLAEDEGVQG